MVMIVMVVMVVGVLVPCGEGASQCDVESDVEAFHHVADFDRQLVHARLVDLCIAIESTIASPSITTITIHHHPSPLLHHHYSAPPSPASSTICHYNLLPMLHHTITPSHHPTITITITINST